MNMDFKHKTGKALIAKVVCLLILMPLIAAHAQSGAFTPDQAAFVELGLKHLVSSPNRLKSKEQTGNRVYIFPNPAKDWAEIKFEGKSEADQVLELHDKQGVQLHTQIWNGEKIDVSQLLPGVYIVTLKQKKQEYSQKLIVSE